MDNLDSKTMHELVGEITDEEIELMDGVPSYEEIYGSAIAAKVLKRLIEGGAVSKESRSDVVKSGNNISIKILLVFFNEEGARPSINTKGRSQKLPQSWTYSDLGNNRVMVEFKVK